MRRALLPLLVLPALLLSACGGASAPAAPTLHGAAEPGTAPPAPAGLAGTVTPVGTGPEGVVVTAAGTAFVALRDPGRVAVVDAAGHVVRMVALSGAPRHLQLASPTGPVLAPLEGSDTLVELDGRTGAVVRTVPAIPRQPHDAALASTGVVAVSDELGGGVWFVPPTGAPTRTAGPVQPGGIAAAGRYAVTADVRGLGVWVYDTGTGALVKHAPVGQGLTHVVALDDHRVAVADTDGSAVYVLSVPDLRPLQVLPQQGGRPYGLAVDAARSRLYVAQTTRDEVRAYDLAAPAAPLATAATVQQPNSLAVDPRTGQLVIAGAAKGVLQRLSLR